MLHAPVPALHHGQFDVDDLVAAKHGRRTTVCIPARDEEATVGPIVETIVGRLVGRHGLVDEVLVVDDGSNDATAAVARRAGARVVSTVGLGKGGAMWTGVFEADGDVIAFCDADVSGFRAAFAVGLLGPLLTGEDLGFVKAHYERPYEGRPGEGGRVTELVAKPVLRLLFPHLGPLLQPLAGECAGRRSVLEQLPFVQGYGVDLALVIDVADRFGVDTLGQVDLGRRVHRNRPLPELALQAEAVLATALARAGLAPPVPECPPLVEVAAYLG